MKITVRYFASLREALGTTETIEIAEGTTLGALRDRLIASSERHARALARGRAVRCAMDHAMSAEDAVIAADAEVAFFPPVTGG
jgi:molybdopterin synthase sulfur carrier subunit